jgi:hypothetical protein
MKNCDMPAMPVSSEQGSDIDSAVGSPEKYGMPTGLGLTKREHFAIELFKAIVIANNGDTSALGKGAALDAIESANILLAALEES